MIRGPTGAITSGRHMGSIIGRGAAARERPSGQHRRRRGLDRRRSAPPARYREAGGAANAASRDHRANRGVEMAGIEQKATRRTRRTRRRSAAWDGPLFDRFVQFREIVIDAASALTATRRSSVLEPQPGERVLDIGCGFGDTTQRLARLVGAGGEAVGVDAAPRFIETPRGGGAGRRRATRASAVADVQGDGASASRFDLAFSRFGTMFFANPVRGAAQRPPRAEPGGRLVMVVWRRRRTTTGSTAAQTIVEGIVSRPAGVRRADLRARARSRWPTPTRPARSSCTRASRDVALQPLRPADPDRPRRRGSDRRVMAIGPAGEILRLAGERATHLHGRVDEALRQGMADMAGPDGVERHVLHLARDRADGLGVSEQAVSVVALDRSGDERFQTLRRQLGVTSFGINLVLLAPGERGRIHSHERQEEVYLVLEGELTLLHRARADGARPRQRRPRGAGRAAPARQRGSASGSSCSRSEGPASTSAATEPHGATGTSRGLGARPRRCRCRRTCRAPSRRRSAALRARAPRRALAATGAPRARIFLALPSNLSSASALRIRGWYAPGRATPGWRVQTLRSRVYMSSFMKESSPAKGPREVVDVRARSCCEGGLKGATRAGI